MRVETIFTSVILRLHAMERIGLDDARSFGGDQRPFHLRPARIQNAHRNVFLDGRQHRRRMQHFRAEIREFRGFRERTLLHAVAARQNGGVGGQHAVDVSPDLDLFRANARADDGRRVVRSAAAQRAGDTVFRRADESAHHDDVLGRSGGIVLHARRVGLREKRRGLRVAAIGHDHRSRIQMRRFDPQTAESRRDDDARKAFAVRRKSHR